MPSFYNSISLPQLPLFISERKASAQEAEILRYFERHRGESFTPADVHIHFRHWPITSIRRSITNLTNQNKLIKTDEQRVGEYGVYNYCWRVR